MASETTVTLSGACSVPLKITEHEKDPFAVIHTAKADDTKLKPFVVFKGKGTQLIKLLEKIPGIIVCFSKNGWMNDALPVEYLNSLIGAFSSCLGAYKYHISELV